MANTFNIKQFLQENKVGPYGVIKESSKKKKKSLKENYIDLRPVGAGAPFGGYTKALKEDLEEDDIYMGPKKPEPNQIYNTPQGEEELGEDNAWMKDVHDKKVGDFTVNYEHPGILVWTNEETYQYDSYFVATPKWDGPGTPIEFVKEGGDSEVIYVEKQDEFVSFEEYAETIEPILEKYLQAKKRGEVDEDINNGPVGNDKLEEFEDDDIEGTERMQGIISREDMKNFIHFASRIFKDLLDDGFEPEDIEEFLIKEIRSIIS
jgi:hypothetical protein